MTSPAESHGTVELLFWLLQAVWGLCTGLLFLWMKNLQSTNDRQDADIKEISKTAYTSAEGINNLKEGMQRVESKIDRLMEKQRVS